MGDVKIRYYVTKRSGGRKMAYWAPCLARPNKKTGRFEPTLMAKLGFKHEELGADGPQAWAIAESWNRKWDAARVAYLAKRAAGAPIDTTPERRAYPENSLGEAFNKFRDTGTWTRKKPRTREDWDRGWNLIEPVFGDVDPRTVGLEEADAWYAALLDRHGVREAHRAMKIWRALWQVAATIKRADGERYCDKKEDPSLGIRRKTPKARSAVWFEGEAVRLVKRAVRMGYPGLAAALAVAWDTMLSPVDVVSLSKAKLKKDAEGPLLDLDRTKTGRAAVCTLSRRTVYLFNRYVASLPFELHPETPFFHTRGGQPGPKGGRPRPPAIYTVNKLGHDFRKVRAVEFPGDHRQVMDLRRSGAVETHAGAAEARIDLSALAGAMANTIDTNEALRATYLPPDATVVRMADAARAIGRRRLRDTRGK